MNASAALPHPQVGSEQPAAEGEEQEGRAGQPEEQGGNQDLWDSLLTVLPQQWHQALNLLRVSGSGWEQAVGCGGVVW